jgi:hypothetical protein
VLFQRILRSELVELRDSEGHVLGKLREA